MHPMNAIRHTKQKLRSSKQLLLGKLPDSTIKNMAQRQYYTNPGRQLNKYPNHSHMVELLFCFFVKWKFSHFAPNCNHKKQWGQVANPGIWKTQVSMFLFTSTVQHLSSQLGRITSSFPQEWSNKTPGSLSCHHRRHQPWWWGPWSPGHG